MQGGKVMRDRFAANARLLTYLGVLPFLACTAAIAAGYEQVSAQFILQAYGAVIVSFVSGIHWGVAMKSGQGKNRWLLLTSNVIALASWLSLLVHHAIGSLLLQTICLILLLVVDAKLFKLGEIDSWFFKLRQRVTLALTITLIIAIVNLS
jgi:hypothetical protein